MKKYALLLSLLSLFSCEKVDLSEVTNPDFGKGFSTTLSFSPYTVSDFSETSRSVKPLKEVATVLNVGIYKEDGTRQTVINQKLSDESYGTITTKLPEGNYKVIAVAHNGNGNATTTNPSKITFHENKLTDTFTTCYDLHVSGANSHNLTLTRCIAKFSLTIEDEIPEEVSTMKFYYTGGSSTLDGNTGLGCVNSRQTELRNVVSHSAGQEFSIYTFPHEQESKLNITITALDSEGNAFCEKTLTDVPIALRKYTTYHDHFFDSSTTGSSQTNTYSILVNDEWDGEIIYP